MDRKIIIENGKLRINETEIVLDNIKFINILGEGANGTVFKAFDEMLMRDIAIKIWFKKQNIRDQLKQGLLEARKVAALNHENIITVYFADLYKNKFIYLASEYLDGITLGEYLGSNIDFDSRFNIWNKIKDALSHAYQHGIYHGDLHDRNILIINGFPKIIDFGTSYFVKNKKDRLLRESKLLRKLVFRIFPEGNKKLFPPPELPILRNPKLVFSICKAWVNILYDFRNAERNSDNYNVDSHAFRSSLYNIAGSLANCPLIPYENVFDILAGLRDDEVYMYEFLSRLLTFCKLILSQNDAVDGYAINNDIEWQKGLIELSEFQILLKDSFIKGYEEI